MRLTDSPCTLAVTTPSQKANAADYFGLGPSEQSQQTSLAVPATGNGPGMAPPSAGKQKPGRGAPA